ncbi:MAG: hypothetical protein NTZ16_05605 [Verrucomicrobia bacterium]|nr:hypothetical protein [Verrucomicrobiota bacterium]
MKTNPNPDPLDALLRDADEHIADGGFTARVASALPRRRRGSWMRLAVLAAAVLVCGALAVWQFPALVTTLAELPRQARAFNVHFLLALLPALIAFAALGWGVFELVNEDT